MKKRLLFFLIIILIFFVFNLNVNAQSDLAMSIRNHLIVIDEYSGHFPENVEINFYQELMDFYNKRYYRAIWFDENDFDNNPNLLLKEIKNSYQEGLEPEDYYFELIKGYLNDDKLFSEESLAKRAILDILLTNSYLNLASDYLSGKIDPEVILADYNYHDDELEIQQLLDLLVKKDNISQILNSKLPTSRIYRTLREKLYYYRDSGYIKGWPTIEYGEKISENDQGARVKQLINNLTARNYLDQNQIETEDYFSQQVTAAVRKFQSDNGLKTDGIVGNHTIRALNISLQQRIKQLIINMERWRWLPETLGKRYIYVNIADYNLKLFDNSQLLMEMKTIVGREQRRTPVFSDQIQYLVFNPYWYVPNSIAVKDKLPLIKKDYNYLIENNFSLFQYRADKLVRINPAAVNWNRVTKQNFNYLLRQNPGDQNALGRVKFMFPNKFSVYLHDTPSKHLFSENERGFSSGCIRIEKPVDLAEYLLSDQEEWDRESIEAEMKKDREKKVYLKNPIQIYLQYNTAWVDSDGNLNFREDIYNRDQTIIEEYFKN